MATEEQVEQLRASVDEATKKPIAELIERATWGEFNFRKAESDLKRAFSLLDPLKVLPIEIIPDGTFPSILDYARQVAASVKQIDMFSPFGGEAAEPRRDTICAQLKSQVDVLHSHVAPHIPFLAYQRGDIQQQLTQLGAAVREAKNLLEAAKTDTEQRKGELTAIVDAARMAAAQAGAAVFVQDFDAEAKAANDAATGWLRWAGVLAGLGVLASIGFLAWIPSDTASLSRIVQVSLSKLLIVGTLIGAALWCGSIYKAMKHQAATNRHRANGLKTFQAFAQAATDEDAKKAVLLETVKSIFALSPSGFLHATETNTDTGLKAADALRIFKG